MANFKDMENLISDCAKKQYEKIFSLTGDSNQAQVAATMHERNQYYQLSKQLMGKTTPEVPA